MTLQYVAIYECCFDLGLVCISTPICFPYGAVVLFCSELVVVTFHAVYYYASWSGFLYFMGLSTFRISTSVFVMSVEI
jgi:hypothetical protein